MSEYDIERLFSEVSADIPCGQDLSYDQDFLALERMLQTKGDGILGVVEEQEEPNWSEVADKSFELLNRSKDLRIVMYFTLALLKKQGFAGLCDGLYVLCGLLDRFWDTIFPQLDPDDDNDPLERINIISALSPNTVSVQDPMKFRQRMMDVALCSSRQLGEYSYRDIEVAKGTITVPDEQAASVTELSVISAAFQDTDVDELKLTFHAIEESLNHISTITDVFTQRAAGGQTPDVNEASILLKKIRKCVQEYLAKLGGAIADSEGIKIDSEGIATVDQGEPAISLSGEIRSPHEAVMAIEKVCKYFERNEPSSPVPLLLNRAKKLVSKSFFEIIEDFCPDGVGQVETIIGTTKDPEAE